MIKRIASKLFGKKQTQLPLENEVSEVFDEEALEEYFHRLPGMLSTRTGEVLAPPVPSRMSVSFGSGAALG